MDMLKLHQQEPPFSVQIELTEGCNLRCSFCGLNGIRGKENNFKFLTVESAQKIASRLAESCWNSRIEFAMHGEPTANPNIYKILSTFRRVLPRHHMMLSTNGYGLVKNPTQKIDNLLRWLNVLLVEDYEGVNLCRRIQDGYEGKHEPKFYPTDKSANPHRRRKPSEHDLVIVQDIKEATTGTHASLNNHCGAGAPLNNNAQGKRCAKPFRELSIRWDGAVAVCCNDWRGVLPIGNVLDQSLDEMWNSRVMQAVRRKLYHGQRNFGPCNGCDALSYRPGLLPDHKGQQTLPRPTAADIRVIELACQNGPLTEPVLRPWEVGAKIKPSD